MKFRRALVSSAVGLLLVSMAACGPAEDEGADAPSVTPTSIITNSITSNSPSPTLEATARVVATPAPTREPTPVTPTTYVVESGDYASLIAEKLAVPLEARDAWIEAMLVLNETDSMSLQVGQVLQLPSVNGTSSVAPLTLAQVEPTGVTPSQPEPTIPALAPTVVVQATLPANTPVPVIEPTGTTAPPTATNVPLPTQPPVLSGGRWYVSSHHSAEYYYCEADNGWRGLSETYLRVYNSEAELQADWGPSRTKHYESVC